MVTNAKLKIQDENFSLTNRTKGKLPRLPFSDMKNASLGKRYNLSLVFIGEKMSKTLNNRYRGKNKPTNILSFPITKTEGEIFITTKVAEKECQKFDRKLDNFIAFLFIHGLLHLKGLSHGSTMEKAEVKLRKQFFV